MIEGHWSMTSTPEQGRLESTSRSGPWAWPSGEAPPAGDGCCCVHDGAFSARGKCVVIVPSRAPRGRLADSSGGRLDSRAEGIGPSTAKTGRKPPQRPPARFQFHPRPVITMGNSDPVDQGPLRPQAARSQTRTASRPQSGSRPGLVAARHDSQGAAAPQDGLVFGQRGRGRSASEKERGEEDAKSTAAASSRCGLLDDPARQGHADRKARPLPILGTVERYRTRPERAEVVSRPNDLVDCGSGSG